MRIYRYKPYKKEKRVLAATLAFVLFVTASLYIKNSSNKKYGQDRPVEVLATIAPTKKPEPLKPVPTATPEPRDNTFNKGDSVITTDTVNMRLNTSTKSYKMGSIPKDTVVDRILSMDGFDLVRYGDKIAFVSTEFTEENIPDTNNEYYYLERYIDIVTTTSTLNFRMGPSTNENSKFILDKNEELGVIGKAFLYSNSELWYLVRARGEYGFVRAKYTKSLKETVKSMDPNIEDVTVKELSYVTESTTAYSETGKKKFKLNKYQLVEVLAEYDYNYLVLVDGKVGFINKDKVKKLPGKFISIDISKQRLTYHVNKDVAFVGRCTTGADKTPTPLGYFHPNVNKNSHSFGNDHTAKILWRAWGTEGIHDADWEPDEKFGDPKYRKNNGSKGCTRVANDVAWYIREEVPENAPVLILE